MSESSMSDSSVSASIGCDSIGSASTHLHLRAAGTSVLLRLSETELPQVLHWGTDLGETNAVELQEFAHNAQPSLENSIDVPIALAAGDSYATPWVYGCHGIGLDPERKYAVSHVGPMPPLGTNNNSPAWMSDGGIRLSGAMLAAAGLAMPPLQPEHSVVVLLGAIEESEAPDVAS